MRNASVADALGGRRSIRCFGGDPADTGTRCAARQPIQPFENRRMVDLGGESSNAILETLADWNEVLKAQQKHYLPT